MSAAAPDAVTVAYAGARAALADATTTTPSADAHREWRDATGECGARAPSPVSHLVVVAGGKGERLARLTGGLPKALVPVGGKPVLAHQLALARAHAMRSATIFAGFAAQQIVSFAYGARTRDFPIDVRVEDRPLGSAGALLAALDALPEHFIVVYGDVMLAVDLARMAETHLARGADVTALVHPNDHPHDSDLLETDAAGWVRAVHPHPHPEGRWFGNLVNAAVYVVRRDALRGLGPDGDARADEGSDLGAAATDDAAKCDFAHDVLPALVARGARVLGYRSTEYAKDMGTPERLARVDADWHAGRIVGDGHDGRGHPAVLFDRDGTLNVSAGFINDAAQIELYPGTGPALRSLREAGFRLAILTNQPVIARGEATEDDVAAIHRCLEWKLGEAGAYVDGIYVCPHHPDGGFEGERSELKVACACRKPATGLFDAARRELDLDPARSWMIGDTTRDIEMARRAGLRSILVLTGEAGRDGLFPCAPDYVAKDIAEAAAFIRMHTHAAAMPAGSGAASIALGMPQ